ncbi:MAG TPA: GAF domain-containing sensor histidine kinase [Symbiobacteriaceae bacterium]|nr:GAF domain-containing sensor histidine kinase [Symbiobacteriaceae bacterium]
METNPFLLFDANRRVAALSPGAAGVLGLSTEVVPGMACRDTFDCPACTGEACPLRQALAGETAEGLLPGLRIGGPLVVSSAPIEAPGQAMALLQLRMPEPEQVMLGAGLRPVLDTLRAGTGSDLAALAVYDEYAGEIRWQVTSGSANPEVSAIRLRPGQGFAGRIVMTDLPLRTFRFPQDLTEDPGSYPIFLAEGLQAALGVPLHGSDGRVLGALMVASRQDRAYSEADLAQVTCAAEQLTLAARLLGEYGEAIRAERSRLAHEVHDGLSQNLFGLKLLLFDLQEQYREAPAGARAGLAEVRRLLDSALTDVRRFIADLRQTAQVQGGLVSALSDCLAQFYRLTRLQVELAIRLEPGEPLVVADRAEVLRVVQEALMNVHRHACAAHVWVEVARHPGNQCRITVADDGCGFTPSAVAEGHFGLATMRERARRLGGTLQVQSAPGQGTTVVLCFPV